MAEKVLPISCYLAEQCQATIILFHVVEKDAPQEIHGQRHLREVDEAGAYLAQIAKQYASEKVSIAQDVHDVQEDGVAQTIRDHVEELQADLIVLCAHGHGGLRDILFGSIAQQVVRQVTVPVLFVRPGMVTDSAVRPVHQVLLPLDGSKSHEAVLPVAAYVAAQCQAKIRLLTVIPTPDTLSGKEALTSRYYPNTKMLSLDISAQQAENYLSGVARDLSSQGVAVSDVVLRGDAASQILDTIETEGIDLVILATHAQSTFNSHWEGSLTPRLFSKTPVPVMLVRVPADHQD